MDKKTFLALLFLTWLLLAFLPSALFTLLFNPVPTILIAVMAYLIWKRFKQDKKAVGQKVRKYCENCGAGLAKDDEFCPDCGKSIKEETA